MEQPVVGYHLTSEVAVDALRAAAVGLGAKGTAARVGVAPPGALIRLAVLVYDGSPWGAGADKRITAVHHVLPRLPVVLYYPETREALAMAARSARYGWVVQKMQMLDNREPARLRALLRPFVAAAWSARFSSTVAILTRHLPERCRRFVDAVVVALGGVEDAVASVAQRAARAGVSLRSLGRDLMWVGATRPKPLAGLAQAPLG